MTNRISPPSLKQSTFKVSQGGKLEVRANGLALGIDLEIDEALSLALLLIYETRERIAVLRKQQQGEAS